MQTRSDPPMSSSCWPDTLQIRVDADVPTAQCWARAIAAAAGFDLRQQWEIAIAVGEAVSNILKFGPVGSISLRFCDQGKGWLEMEAIDSGPGIADLALAEQDGISEGLRRGHAVDITKFRGLGLGLGAIRRMMDDISIAVRKEGGTRLIARKHRR